MITCTQALCTSSDTFFKLQKSLVPIIVIVVAIALLQEQNEVGVQVTPI